MLLGNVYKNLDCISIFFVRIKTTLNQHIWFNIQVSSDFEMLFFAQFEQDALQREWIVKF